MNGRKENDIANRNRINIILKNQPNILHEYSCSLNEKETSTHKAYVRYVKTFLEFLKVEVNMDVDDINSYKNIKVSHINRFMEYIKFTNGKENGASIRATKLYAVSDFFEFLINDGYIEYNPCKRIKTPKDNIEKEIIAMDINEIQTLEENIRNGVGSHRSVVRNRKWINRDLAIVMIGCSTGLRVSAIVQINMSDLDLDHNKIRVIEKGGIGKNIYIGNNLKNQLLDWINDRNKLLGDSSCQALFISNQKKRVTTECVRLIIKRNTYNINKKITPHKMRATCATRLYEATGDIYRVQQQLGHKSIKNTERYAKVTEKKKIESANILDSMF